MIPVEEDQDELRLLLNDHGIELNHKRNTIVQFQGETVQSVAIVLSGEAHARTYSKEGTLVWIDRFLPGQIYGIEALAPDYEIPYEIVAKRKLKVLSVNGDRLKSLIEANNDLSQAILRHLVQRLNTTTARFIESNSFSVKDRVCAELARMSKPIGISPDKHIIRPIPVFTELALRIGSTRETVSRTVSDLTRSGHVQRETGALIIPDLERLKDGFE